MRDHYRKLFVAALVIFVAFAPSLFAELCTVDDQDAYAWIENSCISIKRLFFPHVSGGGYYRPLVGLSYLFDKHVWFMDTRLMHLDNIVFHIFNVLLVYWIASLLIRNKEHRSSVVPLVAALMFGLHPITTESVDWISGRTDAMACTFVLLSSVFILKFRETKRISLFLSAAFLLVPGLLVKETAIAFIFGAFFILNARQEGENDLDEKRENLFRDHLILVIAALCSAVLMLITYNVWLVFVASIGYFIFIVLFQMRRDKGAQFKSVILAILVAVVVISASYLIRKLVFVSNLATIPRTLKLIGDDLNYALQTFFGAAGFYLKKFFFPLPLNFAIREIDPLYNIAGVVLFFVCIYWIRKRTIVSSLYLAGVCLFLPALPLSLGTVTWTGYAERYIYISSAFWVLATVLWGRTFLQGGINKRFVAAAILLLVFIMGVVTFRRSVLWQSNLTLLEDTVNRSPNFKTIRADYMQVLINHGDLEKAKLQYDKINRIPSVGYMEKPDLLMAIILCKEGKYREALELHEKIIEKTKGKSASAYELYISFLQERFNSAKREHDSALAKEIGSRMLECMEKLYQVGKDPMILYRAGQWALSLGYRDKSYIFFSEASRKFPVGDKYAVFAYKLASNLENNSSQVNSL